VLDDLQQVVSGSAESAKTKTWERYIVESQGLMEAELVRVRGMQMGVVYPRGRLLLK